MSQTKINHNMKYLILIVAILIIIYTMISKDNLQQKSNQNPTILDNALTTIVTPKKSKKAKQKQANKIITQEEYSEPFMVDESDYRPFQLDDLLDPADRNEKSAKAIFNYNNLLEITHVLNSLRNETLSIDDIGVDEIKDWVKVLIYDEYYRNAFYKKLPNTIEINNLAKIDSSILPTLDNLSDRMSQGYLGKITELSKATESLNDDLPNDRKSIILNQIKQLSFKAKEYSNSFLRSKVKNYFTNNNFTLQEKINFANKLYESKDLNLMNFAKGYFEEVETKDKESLKMIQNIIKTLSRGKDE